MPVNYWIRTGIITAFLLGTPAVADILKIGEGDPQVVERDDRPARGMSQMQVVDSFGEPQLKVPAVGDPPISRWDYSNYSVYFEGNYVLHSVDYSTPNVERAAPGPVSPQP